MEGLAPDLLKLLGKWETRGSRGNDRMLLEFGPFGMLVARCEMIM